jgi:hypothetical protein
VNLPKSFIAINLSEISPQLFRKDSAGSITSFRGDNSQSRETLPGKQEDESQSKDENDDILIVDASRAGLEM